MDILMEYVARKTPLNAVDWDFTVLTQGASRSSSKKWTWGTGYESVGQGTEAVWDSDVCLCTSVRSCGESTSPDRH